MSEQKKKLVAYHEAGHAILGALMSHASHGFTKLVKVMWFTTPTYTSEERWEKEESLALNFGKRPGGSHATAVPRNDYDIVSKISIVPRGPAGGVTIFMPSEERLNSGLYSKEFLENRMCVALGGRLAEEIINGKDNVTTGASNDFQQCTQVAKQMVMQLGMSPEIGQRLLGGQQQGGPFMGRDFMGQGAPPISQALKQKVDDEVKRIVDEQYQRGMKLLRDNMFLLDELAKMLMEEEKVSGDALLKLINKAAAEGKLVMANSKMAVAAYAGEVVETTADGTLNAKSKCVHPDKPMMFACADCPRRGFAGSCAPTGRKGVSRGAVARLGLSTEAAERGSQEACTSEEVIRRVEEMAADVSNGSALPSHVVQSAASQALVALAAMAAPLPALAGA
eukprot:g22075.t1